MFVRPNVEWEHKREHVLVSVVMHVVHHVLDHLQKRDLVEQQSVSERTTEYSLPNAAQNRRMCFLGVFLCGFFWRPATIFCIQKYDARDLAHLGG